MIRDWFVIWKIINNNEEKVRDHCQITGKFRGAAYRNCNVNCQLTKKVPVIFHNLRGYGSHLVFYELKKVDVKINLIPNGLQKCKEFILNKDFIDIMQFINSSPEKLVKNLTDNDFKYLTQEFGLKYLELLKEKDAYPYKYMKSFKRFTEEKQLPDKKNIFTDH